MAETEQYTLKVRRFKPESGDGPYWENFDVELDPTLSVLDGLLQAKDRDDGSLVGALLVPRGDLRLLRGEDQRPVDARLPDPDRRGARVRPTARDEDGEPNPVVVEPMGNMPVIKDLVTDMESTHWTKIRRVTPWLLDDGDPPERERVVPPESMVDITQTIACIQCGACVSACLSMEADPDFIGPAALAKAYRFVGDPRDVETPRAPLRPRPGPARDLRLHPLLLAASTPARRASRRWTRSCACAAPPATTRRSRTATTATTTRPRS